MQCGGHKCPVLKGVTYGKLVHRGVNWLKFAQSLQSVAHSFIDPFHKAIKRNPDTQWITKSVHKHREIKG